jgi:hypothetical protein
MAVAPRRRWTSIRLGSARDQKVPSDETPQGARVIRTTATPPGRRRRRQKGNLLAYLILTSVVLIASTVTTGSVPASALGATRSRGPGPGAALTRAAAETLVLSACRESKTDECGTIEVTLYWTQPSDQTMIKARFEIFPHSDTTAPPTEPIVAMEGGPGYPSIDSKGEYIPMLGPLLENHDLILMDQRGTGTSNLIDCPTLQRYNGLQAPDDAATATAACAKKWLS